MNTTSKHTHTHTHARVARNERTNLILETIRHAPRSTLILDTHHERVIYSINSRTSLSLFLPSFLYSFSPAPFPSSPRFSSFSRADFAPSVSYIPPIVSFYRHLEQERRDGGATREAIRLSCCVDSTARERRPSWTAWRDPESPQKTTPLYNRDTCYRFNWIPARSFIPRVSDHAKHWFLETFRRVSR